MQSNCKEAGMLVRTRQYPHRMYRWKILCRLPGTPVMYSAIKEDEKIVNGETVVNLIETMIMFPNHHIPDHIRNTAIKMIKSIDPTEKRRGMNILKGIF